MIYKYIYLFILFKLFLALLALVQIDANFVFHRVAFWAETFERAVQISTLSWCWAVV